MYPQPVIVEHNGTSLRSNKHYEAFIGPRCDMAEAVEFLRTAADLVQSELDAESADDCAQSTESPELPGHPMVVNIRPGDIVVVHSDKRFGTESKDRLRTEVTEVAPGAKLLVVDDGATLSHILRPSE